MTANENRPPSSLTGLHLVMQVKLCHVTSPLRSRLYVNREVAG